MRSKMTIIALLGSAMVTATAFAAQPARPGTVNYIEGAVYLDSQPLSNNDVGNISLERGQELRTESGKAEILLTPGVFLRVNDNSTVRLVSPDLMLTQVEVEKGRVGVEVDEIHDQNNLQIIDAGVTTRLDKKGYYEFDADQPMARVFTGMAKTEVADGKWREIKGHHELALTANLDKQKPANFDSQRTDELYNWSSLRSQYLAESNNQVAEEYGEGGYYPGWYWNPYGWGYTFIGGGPFYSPFGWGYYPFGWGGGWYGGRGGWYGHPYRDGGYSHGPARGVYGGGFHGAGGFHGGSAGGFHGGGGRR